MYFNDGLTHIDDEVSKFRYTLVADRILLSEFSEDEVKVIVEEMRLLPSLSFNEPFAKCS